MTTKISIKFIVLVLFAYGCQKNNNQDLIDIDSDVLKEYTKSAEIYEIDLDDIETTEIELTEDNVIYSVHQNTAEDGVPLLGHMNLADKFQDKFYVYDIPSTGLYLIDNNGDISGPIMRTGRGPNEHSIIGNLKANTEYLYASDINNVKIHRLTHSLENAEPFSDLIIDKMDLNDEIFLRRGSDIDDNVLIVSSVHNLQDTIATLLPKLVPLGFQPQIFNRVKFSVNNENDILASYLFLPMLFVFNEGFSLKQVIVLDYAAFDTLDTPEFELEKHQPGKRYGGYSPINNFMLMDNGDIYITLRNEIIELKMDQSGRYFLSKKFAFKHPFPVNPGSWVWVLPEIFAKEKGTLFVRNPEYLLKISIPN